MKTKQINNADDFLGSSETRYFSNGYKHILYSLTQTSISNSKIESLLKVDVNKNAPSPISHLGAIEYVAIASYLCEQLLRKEYNLTNEEIACAWIHRCFLKIKQPTPIEEGRQTNVCAEIQQVIQTESSINGYRSKINVSIGDAIIKIEIDHPITWWLNVFPTLNENQSTSNLYQDGYKQRIHHLTDIRLNTQQMVCDASIHIIANNRNNHGIGANYNTTLLPDIINISGQLSQILLYTLEGITRKEANNMWLREFSLVCPKPTESLQYPARIIFNQFNKINIRQETWRSVSLTGYLGSIIANFKITHKLNA